MRKVYFCQALDNCALKILTTNLGWIEHQLKRECLIFYNLMATKDISVLVENYLNFWNYYLCVLYYDKRKCLKLSQERRCTPVKYPISCFPRVAATQNEDGVIF